MLLYESLHQYENYALCITLDQDQWKIVWNSAVLWQKKMKLGVHLFIETMDMKYVQISVYTDAEHELDNLFNP